MRKSQVRRAVVAARADHTPRVNDQAQTGLPLDSLTVVKPYGFTGTRRHGNKARMTDAQRDSTGRFSDWNRSPFTPRGGWR